MEHFGAREDRPKDVCLKAVREESDIFVGIYAHRYGEIPEGETKSITELEYDTATKVGLPIFIFFVDESTPWIPSYIDKGENGKKLNSFKRKLKVNGTYSSFSNKDKLAAEVASSLGRYFVFDSLQHFEQRSPPDGKIPTASEIKTREEWNSYRLRCYDDCRYTFLVHTVKRSKTIDRWYDIAIYLSRHKKDIPNEYILSDVDHAEFFLGPSWNDEVFYIENNGGLIGISVSAWGSFLCVCKVTFKDSHQVLLSRYVDYEMEKILT